MLLKRHVRRNVLLALDVHDDRLHRGVLRFAREHDWRVQLVGPGSWRHFQDFLPDGVISLMQPAPGEESQGAMGQAPQGTFSRIAENVEVPTMTDHLLALRVPLVDLSLRRPRVKVARLIPDNVAAGQVAAKHLLERGGRHFLYVAYSDTTQDVARWEGFSKTLRGAGFSARKLYLAPAGIRSGADMWAALNPLKKPLAVFCAFDIWAALVLEGCRLGKWRVPEDVMILGCYNHELISALAPVPLSSVDMNIELRGYMAAQLLEKILSGKAAHTTRQVSPVGGVIVRESTGKQAAVSSAVSAALHYIRENLHRTPRVLEVAKAAGVSRSVLQWHFSRHLGHGVGEAIFRAKMTRAEELLRTTTMTGMLIADTLGYGSVFQFYRAFKRHRGMTTLQFREAKK